MNKVAHAQLLFLRRIAVLSLSLTDRHSRRSRPKREASGGARERDHVRRVSRPLGEGQASSLQSLLLRGVYQDAGETRQRRAVRLPRVS